MTSLVLFLWSDDEFHRSVARGSARRAAECGWRLHICLETRSIQPDRIADLIRAHAADGYLVQGLDTQPALAPAFASAGCPVVAVTGRPLGFAGPTVELDNQEVGRQAAAHLIQRGFRRFAYVGWRAPLWSAARQGGFHEVIAEASLPQHTFFTNDDALLERGSRNRHWTEVFADWLATMPKPIGILAHGDDVGADVVRICVYGGLRVPDDVAVVGVGNDTFICETVQPALSSVRSSGIDIGYEAARRLGLLLAGETVEATCRIAPAGIEARRSTDCLAIVDPALRDAVRFIHDHCFEPIALGDVAAAAGLSARTLERRFRAQLGRTATTEMRRMRIDRARQLLTGTARGIGQIAADTGYSGITPFCRAFRAETGISPGRYRAQVQDDAGMPRSAPVRRRSR